ncbi:MAG TPA: hydrogenase maturation protease [Gemmatimonadales bacterium]|nr:hydrogenase maturation protease [Gemmatimonadales bacterium]
MDFWQELARPGADSVEVDGVELRAGSRVRLRPKPGRDAFDAILAGRAARVESVEHDVSGAIHLAVTLDDDPGRDLGAGRFPGHRFFFASDEVEPLEPDGPPGTAETVAGAMATRILVAGIGNIFLGDDGFGVAMAERLASRPWPVGVEVREFGIRGLDLAYELQRGYAAAVLVDAVPRGGAPGTLYVIEPALDLAAEVAVDAHGMDPVKVLHLARALGGEPPRTLVVGCEPEPLPADLDPSEIVAELSAPVRAALDAAVELVESVVATLFNERR